MITGLRLQNFRSYDDASFEVGEGVNIVVGPNASGKTNLLEAVMVLSGGKSYRARYTEMIKNQKAWFRIDADTPSNKRTLKVDDRPHANSTAIFTIGSQAFRRLPKRHILPTVLFEPNHLSLLHGKPENRRNYLDDLLEQTTPEFSLWRRQYQRTLAQRNSLLKHSQHISKQLFAWNVRLSELGGRIAAKRQQLLALINRQASSAYSKIAQRLTAISLLYESPINADNYGSKMLHLLESSQDEDWQRGFTSYGPHRDDWTTLIDGQPMAQVASRGENRTMILVLKIIEANLLEKSHNKKPLFLLDDVFSELDGARRQALTKTIAGYQTFITTTDADVVVQHFLSECTITPLG